MKISLSNLNTKNLATLAQRTIAISNSAQHAVVKNNPLLAAVVSTYADYDAVYTKSAFSGKGGQVFDADARRDEVFAGLKSILLGYIKINGFPLQQDAKDVYHIIELHGIDLDRYSYSEETAQLKKLLEEFEKPENKAKLERLNLLEIVVSLQAAQTEFEAIYSEQAVANAELRQMQSATSCRKSLEVALRNYLNLAAAMSTLTGWDALAAELNEVVKAAKNSKQATTQKENPVVE
jgi:hypothetical protein